MTVIMAAALIFAGFALFRLWRQKKEIYTFTELLEENLDALLTGKPLKKDQETKDTLAGKVNEKLARIQHIQERKAKESLEAKEQMKELISDISHQTRTPIANQKIYLEILRQQELPGEAYGFLDKLDHQTDKLDFLFQSLVKMSRLETGVIQIQKKNCDLAETLKKAVSAVVAAACRRNSVRLIAISTDYVFDGALERPYHEFDLPDGGRTVYGRSKWEGERQIRSLCPDHLICRVSWLYGFGGPSFVHAMRKLADGSGPELKVVSDQIGNPTSAIAVARKLGELLERPALNGTFHLTCEGEASWYDFACEIFALSGISQKVVPCSTAEFPRKAPRPG